MCAATTTFGLVPFLWAMTFPNRSTVISSTWPVNASRTMTRIASSLPAIPGVSESLLSNSMLLSSLLLWQAVWSCDTWDPCQKTQDQPKHGTIPLTGYDLGLKYHRCCLCLLLSKIISRLEELLYS